MLNSRSILASALAVSALTLGACSADPADKATDAAKDGAAAVSSVAEKSGETVSETKAADKSETAAEADVTFVDGVVRAMEEGKDMTAIFGKVTNNSDKDITITGFTADVDAKIFEVHEVVDGVMREKEGGLPIPAGETVELKPGSDHLMIMGVGTPIKAGEEVQATLEFGDGSTLKLDPLPVRTMGAGTENYEDLHGGHNMAGHGAPASEGMGAHAGHDMGHGMGNGMTESAAPMSH